MSKLYWVRGSEKQWFQYASKIVEYKNRQLLFSMRQPRGESDILSGRLYDVDPLFWSKCGYEMKVLAVIMDPYEIKSIDAIITNFHFPHSTLLILVSAFAGYDRIMDAYKAAVEKSIDFFVQ